MSPNPDRVSRDRWFWNRVKERVSLASGGAALMMVPFCIVGPSWVWAAVAALAVAAIGLAWWTLHEIEVQ